MEARRAELRADKSKPLVYLDVEIRGEAVGRMVCTDCCVTSICRLAAHPTPTQNVNSLVLKPEVHTSHLASRNDSDAAPEHTTEPLASCASTWLMCPTGVCALHEGGAASC